MKMVCPVCGSEDYPYHNEGCWMGDIGLKAAKRGGKKG